MYVNMGYLYFGLTTISTETLGLGKRGIKCIRILGGLRVRIYK